MDEFARVAAGPVYTIMGALEASRPEKVVIPHTEDYTFDLEIDVEPIGSTLKSGSVLVGIRWYHHHPLALGPSGRGVSGGGYFFIRPEHFKAFGEALEPLVELAKRGSTSDELMWDAYNKVIQHRYSAPRKRYQRGNSHTERGLFAYRDAYREYIKNQARRIGGRR